MSEMLIVLKEKLVVILKKFEALIKFMSSGVICFLIDQGLFNLFDHVFLVNVSDWWRVAISTLVARIISSFINFTLNRKVVFGSEENYLATLVKYYILCALQLAASAGLTYLFSLITGINETFTKLTADAILFVISYNIQRVLIFKPQKEEVNQDEKVTTMLEGTTNLEVKDNK